ncbi:MAG: IS110 family transposase [Candidatus Korobacteraceae bacterium]
MMIIGCDYHPSFQQIAWLDKATGETGEQRLEHSGEAEAFYRARCGQPVRVGIEATGGTRWFERLLAECGIELWVGNPAKIRAAETRKQKTDRRDAELLLQLLLENRFPRLVVPSAGQRNLRQLVGHRHRLVQMQTRVKNQVQALAMNEGLQLRRGLWTRKGQAQLQALALPCWGERKRCDLLELLADLQRRGADLDKAVEATAEASPVVRHLRQQRGVGPVVGLAYELTILDPLRFQSSRQVASYLGLIPSERSSGGKQRLGHISKQGNALLRGLLVEAAHVAVRWEPEWRRQYVRLAMKKNRSIAAVAMARKLAVRLWWLWKSGLATGQIGESGSHAE